MKIKLCFLALIYLYSPAFSAKKEKKTEDNPYAQMAAEISSSASLKGVKKAAVLPFSQAQSTEVFKEGSIISERLITNLVKEGKIEIVERSQLEKVLSELKLENSGTVDLDTAKNIGKILGVDAIVTGTIIKTVDGKAEINVRLIQTEDAKILGAFSEKVEIDWLIKDKEKADKKVIERRTLRF